MFRKIIKNIGYGLSEFTPVVVAALILAALAIFAFIDLDKMNVFNANGFWEIVSTAVIWVIIAVILSIPLANIFSKLSKISITFGEYTPKQKSARLKFTKTISSNEIYIKVQNGEWWLDAKDMCATIRKKEQWVNINDDRAVKWKDSTSPKIMIRRKSHEYLHFATINQKNNKYLIHTVREDQAFSQHTSAVFHLYITGNMKRKSINIRKDIVVENNQGELHIEINDVQVE
ncbi:MAG: hypothetical protein FJZ86_10465 [Chloroflexi bacterium]|nr:hypothetical protein [Chloroflexota bacterium]